MNVRRSKGFIHYFIKYRPNDEMIGEFYKYLETLPELSDYHKYLISLIDKIRMIGDCSNDSFIVYKDKLYTWDKDIEEYTTVLSVDDIRYLNVNIDCCVYFGF